MLDCIKTNSPWAATTIIVLCSILSPLIQSLINTHHERKMKAIEWQCDIALRQNETFYADRKETYLQFVKVAGEFLPNPTQNDLYKDLLTSAENVILFCSPKNHSLIIDFMRFINNASQNNSWDTSSFNDYTEKLHIISVALNYELASVRTIREIKYL